MADGSTFQGDIQNNAGGRRRNLWSLTSLVCPASVCRLAVARVAVVVTSTPTWTGMQGTRAQDSSRAGPHVDPCWDQSTASMEAHCPRGACCAALCHAGVQSQQCTAALLVIVTSCTVPWLRLQRKCLILVIWGWCVGVTRSCCMGVPPGTLLRGTLPLVFSSCGVS